MGFRRIFRGKRQSSQSSRSHKKNRDRYETHEGNDDDNNSFTGSDVSSLGNSIYSDTNHITSSRQRPTQIQRRIYKPHAVLETVLTEEESSKNQPTTSGNANAIYMFPKTWQERTGEAPTLEKDDDDDSMARRRRLFEHDMDAASAWDTTMSIDESRYTTHRNHGWMACLACV